MHESSVPRTNSFGARLALVRWQMGWNMKEAALACGFSQQSWRGWELQGHDPRGFADVVARISERTGIDEYWLLTGKELPTGPGGPSDVAPKADLVSESAPLDYKVGDSADEKSADIIELIPHRWQPAGDQPIRRAA